MHLQNPPINRCNPSPETTTSQVITYHCFCSPNQKIYSFVHFPFSSVFIQQCKHCCLHQNHISVQPCIKDTRFAGALRYLRANSTHLHFAFAQKIGRVTKSATLPYAFYIFEVLMSPLRFGRCKTDIHRMSCTLFVVWFPVHDPIRPVDLLQQDHAHQLMRKRHFRKADLLLR